MKHSSGRCEEHALKMRRSNRPRYNGTIPVNICRPIRAGLLQGVDHVRLVELIASMEPVEEHNQITTAEAHINEIASHTRLDLQDNGFWWDDTASRITGERYKPQAQKPKNTSGSNSCGPDATTQRDHSATFKRRKLKNNAQEQEQARNPHPPPQDPTDHKRDDVLRGCEPTSGKNREPSSPTIAPVNEGVQCHKHNVTCCHSSYTGNEICPIVTNDEPTQDVVETQFNDDDTQQPHEGVPCHIYNATSAHSFCTGNASDDVGPVSEPTSINDCEASSPTVVPVNQISTDDHEMRDIRPTSPAAEEEVEEMNIVTDPQDMRHHETGLWDDVVCAIRDDLRAFWGLWDTHIAPRIDGGLPVTYNDAEEWNGDNVDVARVFSQLRCLTCKVKTITDAYVPRTAIEKRVLNRVQLLIHDLRIEKQSKLRQFVEELMVCAAAQDFVYPRPVD